jgi:transposase
MQNRGATRLAHDSAQQIIAEIGPGAGAFPTAPQLASWVGVCPGCQESAGESSSNRSAKGNRAMRRLLPKATARHTTEEARILGPAIAHLGDIQRG